jgi:hypothetical protein
VLLRAQWQTVIWMASCLFAPREEHRLMLFQNMVLKKTFEFKRGKVSGSPSVVWWLACLPLDPRFAGSNPAEDDGFWGW